MSRATMKVSSYITTIAATWMGFMQMSAIGAEISVRDIIENVQRNEALYDDIDLKMVEEYSIGDRIPIDEPEGAKEIASTASTLHYVGQQGMFRLDVTGTFVVRKGPVPLDRIRAFDGKTTRSLDQGTVANVMNRKVEDAGTPRPHTLFISSVIHAPLSTFLSGHAAMAAYPTGGKKYRDQLTIAVSYHGDTEFESLPCREVWVTTSAGGTPTDRWELLLAESRNYLPVRMRAFTFHLSNNVPVGEGEIGPLLEVEQGIWFPSSVTIRSFDPAVLQREGKQRPNWERRFTVEGVSLHPNYEVGYFSDVPFPPGTAVYETKSTTERSSKATPSR
jgi:hypothetical protein